MTNYNERLDKALERLAVAGRGWGVSESAQIESMSSELDEAKQAFTSLMKELVAEAKPYRETIIDKWNKDRADEVKATNAAMNAWADIYEQNLLKALEEK